jgi:hypothetical protein
LLDAALAAAEEIAGLAVVGANRVLAAILDHHTAADAVKDFRCGEVVNHRCGLIEAINAWRREQPDLPNRAEAARRLIEAGLRSPVAAKKKK